MILVTGSSGTIGNRLCENLEKNDIDYMGIDIRENIWNEKVNSKTVRLDLRKPVTCDQVQGDIGMIVHLAANARVYKLVQDPNLARDNFLTTYNVFEFARKNKIDKIIFSSSREVYGNSGKVLHNENDSFVKHCESTYTATKIGGEALLHSYNQCYGIDIIILRFSNVYGCYDFSDRVVPLFILKALKNEDLTIYGKNKVLDFTYIDDTVNGIIRSILHFNKAMNKTYNIATGAGFPLGDIAKFIIKNTGSKSRMIFKENRTGEVIRFIADITEARSILSYEPKFDLETGLVKTIKWYSSRLDAYLNQLLNS